MHPGPAKESGGEERIGEKGQLLGQRVSARPIKICTATVANSNAPMAANGLCNAPHLLGLLTDRSGYGRPCLNVPWRPSVPQLGRSQFPKVVPPKSLRNRLHTVRGDASSLAPNVRVLPRRTKREALLGRRRAATLSGGTASSTHCEGSKSSSGLPSGSSTWICLPPGPISISFRKRTPWFFISVICVAKSFT